MSYMEKSYEETIDALKQRNRELTERLEAAERLLALSGRVSRTVMEAAIELAQSTAPVKPVAGEERA